jgi:hypothetical protein
MDIREHSLTLVSVIVGLGVTELLSRLHRLIRARARVDWHPLPLAWAAIAFLLVINLWWGVYLGTVGVATPSSSGEFLLNLATPLLLYLVCAAALPDEPAAEGRLNMREAHYGSCRYLYGLVLAYLLVTLLQVSLSGNLEWSTLAAMRLAVITVLVPLLWVRRPSYHAFAALAVGAALTLRMLTQTLR